MQSVLVGVDVSKATLDVALLPTGECWSVANEDGAVERLVAQLQECHLELIVLEATGGLETCADGAGASRRSSRSATRPAGGT
jgi:transposase